MIKKKILGCVEIINLKGTKKTKPVIALIDTGATYTSIDKELAKEIGFNKFKRFIRIKLKSSEKNYVRRPIIDVIVIINKKEFNIEANIERRQNMNCPVIVGRNLLYGNYIVDVEKNNLSFKINKLKKEFKNKLKTELAGKIL